MVLSRQDFLKVSGGVILETFLFGCKSEEAESKNPIKEEVYSPSVNSKPYFNKDYSVDIGISDSRGIVTIDFSTRRPEFFSVENKYWNSQQGINVWIYEDKKTLERKMYVVDPKENFMPRLIFPNDSSLRSSNLNSGRDVSLKSFSFNSQIILEDGWGFYKGGGIFVNQIKDGLPSYNNCFDSSGEVYLGDWSFNQVKTLNTNLKNTSAIITIIPSPLSPFAASAYGVLSTSGKILDSFDFVADAISELTPFYLDKDKKYSLFYDVPVIGMPGLTFKEPCEKNDTIDIKDLFPIQMGNSWTFGSGWYKSTAKIDGVAWIRGKKLVSILTDGLREYYGFNGKTLNLYGFRNSSVGDVLFNPPIKIGDESIREGSYFPTSSEIVCVDYPEITGHVNEKISYVDRENLVLSNGIPYGDCWKWEEDINITINNNGNYSSTNGFVKHWFAKNVGKVRIENNGKTFDLDSVNLNGENLNSSSLNKLSSLHENSLASSTSIKINELINESR